jgi:hypothetical protein
MKTNAATASLLRVKRRQKSRKLDNFDLAEILFISFAIITISQSKEKNSYSSFTKVTRGSASA